jgi:nickel-dependent lactate racemase
MEPCFVERIFLTPFKTLSEAYEAAKQKLGAEARVIVMPYGGSTLPVTQV